MHHLTAAEIELQDPCKTAHKSTLRINVTSSILHRAHQLIDKLSSIYRSLKLFVLTDVYHSTDLANCFIHHRKIEKQRNVCLAGKYEHLEIIWMDFSKRSGLVGLAAYC